MAADTADHWQVTTKGEALKTVSRAKLSRPKADALVAELLERVPMVNANTDFAYTVETVVLFGSYLSDQDKIGDVDVAVQLRPRHPKGSIAQDALEWASRNRRLVRFVAAKVPGQHPSAFNTLLKQVFGASLSNLRVLNL